MGFLVYLASFRVDGVRRHYVGHTEAVFSERSALLRRRKWHLNQPPAWMMGAGASKFGSEDYLTPQGKEMRSVCRGALHCTQAIA